MRSSTKNATTITLDSEPTKTRSSKHYWHHVTICFQCNTTRRSRHIIRTRCHPPKMQQTSHQTRNPRKPAPQNSTGTMVQYVSSATLHADLGISYVREVIHQKCNKHHTRLEPTKTRSSKHYWHHGTICFQCNTTRRSRHIIRTWGHPPKMQQTSH
jgi:hypothetical protein